DPSLTRLDGVDNVHSVGTGLQIKTKTFDLAPWADITVRYGADGYLDTVRSKASITFVDTDTTVNDPFTQYADRAKYFTSGVWGQVETRLTDFVRLRAGGRG